MWDTLEITHEGTEEVKRSRLNTLSQEYEMFRMMPGENIKDLQKRFTHLTNHLIALAKVFTNNDLNLKVLRSLTRAWQPKVTAISEQKSLSKMTLAALFGKLQEHELELGRLEQQEGLEKNVRSLALKTRFKDNDSSQEEESQSDSGKDDESIEVLVRNFGKFLKRRKDMKSSQVKKFVRKNEASSSRQKFTCFECGNPGHIKSDCPSLQKKNEFKVKKDRKKRRAYIAWENNDVSTTSSSENEEQAHLSLMVSHHSDDDEVSDFDSCDKPSYDEL